MAVVLDTPIVATPPPRPSFAEVLETVYREKYTGSVTLHFIHGVPTVIERPNPVQIRLRQT